MSCEECRELLPQLSQEELLRPERVRPASFAQHLTECPSCRAEADAYQRYHQAVRAAAPCPLPPDGFWDRAAAALDRVERPRPRAASRPLLGWAALALAMLVVAAVCSAAVVAWRARNSAPLGWPAQLYAMAAARGWRPDYPTSDADRAAQWLTQHSERRMPVINLRLAGADLVGAALLPRGRGHVSALFLATSDGPALLAQASNSSLPAGDWRTVRDGSYTFQLLRTGGLIASTWVVSGRRYALVYPGSAQSLLDLSRLAARHCRQGYRLP